MTDDLKKFIGEKVGEATMCWNPIPTGVFDSERASKILAEINTEVYKALRDEVDALITGAYHAPLESVETKYDVLAKQRVKELNDALLQSEASTEATT